MECINCNNCKTHETTYFCLAKNDFVVADKGIQVVEKIRSGWKKGDPGYELHRRKTRKETEQS
jgi:hypothetical protein